jgi:hypothetical protein
MQLELQHQSIDSMHNKLRTHSVPDLPAVSAAPPCIVAVLLSLLPLPLLPLLLLLQAC